MRTWISIEKKESYRWLENVKQAIQLLNAPERRFKNQVLTHK